MISAQVIEELVRAGLGGEALVAAVRRIEAATDARNGSPSLPQRGETKSETTSAAAKRMRRYRDRREANGMSRNQPEYLLHTKTVMERDGHRCVYCGTDTSLQIDHMQPVMQGGTDDLDNLATACKPCNSAKAGKTPEQWGREVIGLAAREALFRYRAKRSETSATNGGTIGGTTLQTTDISGLEERKVEVGSAREAEIPDLPPTLVRRPTPKPPEKAPQRFEEFWAAYPKRAGTNSRKEAAERYRRAIVRGVEEAAIIAGAARYAAFCDAEGNTGTQFVQQAVTWLNQEGWTNEYAPSRKRQSELMDAFDRVGEKLQRAAGNQGADGPSGERHRPLRGYDPPF